MHFRIKSALHQIFCKSKNCYLNFTQAKRDLNLKFKIDDIFKRFRVSEPLISEERDYCLLCCFARILLRLYRSWNQAENGQFVSSQTTPSAARTSHGTTKNERFVGCYVYWENRFLIFCYWRQMILPHVEVIEIGVV